MYLTHFQRFFLFHSNLQWKWNSRTTIPIRFLMGRWFVSISDRRWFDKVWQRRIDLGSNDTRKAAENRRTRQRRCFIRQFPSGKQTVSRLRNLFDAKFHSQISRRLSVNFYFWIPHRIDHKLVSSFQSLIGCQSVGMISWDRKKLPSTTRFFIRVILYSARTSCVSSIRWLDFTVWEM